MRTEQARRIEHLPLFIRCEIEYELNHYGMLKRYFCLRMFSCMSDQILKKFLVTSF
jgi:hypothetical protein